MLNRVRKRSRQEGGGHGGPLGNRSERPAVTVEDPRTAGEVGLLAETGVAYGPTLTEAH